VSGGGIASLATWQQVGGVVVEDVGRCAVAEVGPERSDGRQATFSVLIETPDDCPVLTVDDQRSYEVTVGSESDHVFLVPIGPSTFEAVFTRLVDEPA